MEIGEKIRKIRLLRDYTQKYMAAALGITQAGYSKIERGGCDISLSKLYKICEILDYDFKAILIDDEILYDQNICISNDICKENMIDDLLKKVDLYQKQITQLRYEVSSLKK